MTLDSSSTSKWPDAGMQCMSSNHLRIVGNESEGGFRWSSRAVILLVALDLSSLKLNRSSMCTASIKSLIVDMVVLSSRSYVLGLVKAQMATYLCLAQVSRKRLTKMIIYCKFMYWFITACVDGRRGLMRYAFRMTKNQHGKIKLWSN